MEDSWTYKDYQVPRLIVVLFAFAVPIYFLLLIILVEPLRNPLSPNLLINGLLIYVAMPLTFASPWVLWAYFSRKRLSNSLSGMRAATTIIPFRWRMFYGFNTAIVMLFFVFPAISPPLAVLAGIVVAGRLINRSSFAWSRGGRFLTIYSLLLAVVFIVLPVYFLYEFIPSYLTILKYIWTGWESRIEAIYSFTIWVADSLAIGAVFWFIYEGAAEFEAKTYGLRLTKPPTRAIRLLEILLLCVFLFIGLPMVPEIRSLYQELGLPMLPDPLFVFDSYINPICLAAVCLVTLIGFSKGFKKGTIRAPIAGYVFAAAFVAVEVFWRILSPEGINLVAMTISIVLAFLLFISVFLYCYLRTPAE